MLVGEPGGELEGAFRVSPRKPNSSSQRAALTSPSWPLTLLSALHDPGWPPLCCCHPNRGSYKRAKSYCSQSLQQPRGSGTFTQDKATTKKIQTFSLMAARISAQHKNPAYLVLILWAVIKAFDRKKTRRRIGCDLTKRLLFVSAVFRG